jgi:hypothetical protein
LEQFATISEKPKGYSVAEYRPPGPPDCRFVEAPYPAGESLLFALPTSFGQSPRSSHTGDHKEASFASWWNQTLADRADLAALLRTAAEVMRRRNVAFTPTHAALYRALFEQTAAERRQAVRQSELRVLRRRA